VPTYCAAVRIELRHTNPVEKWRSAVRPISPFSPEKSSCRVLFGHANV